MSITNTFNSNDFPKIIYKYRDWNDKYHKRILTHQELYYAEPNSFLDPKDCKLSLGYNLISEDEIYAFFLNEAKKKYPYLPFLHKAYAEYWYINTPIRDSEHRQNIEVEYREKYNNGFGILSMTPDYENRKMWKEYANIYQGFCIGLDTNILMQNSDCFGGIGFVNYYEKLPTLMPFDSFQTKSENNIFSKLEKYSFEGEIRLFKAKYDNKNWRSPNFPLEALKEIILGPHMKKRDKKEIIRISKSFPNVTIKHAFFDDKCLKVI